MNGKRLCGIGLATALLLALLAGLVLAQEAAGSPVSTAFTYQGRLRSSGTPYTGTCDFQFGLWDSLGGGTPIGTTLTRTGVGVTDGYFTVQLDFGAAAFQGEARWLDISVRCPAGGGTYTPLIPRQPLTPTPYALYAKSAPWTGLAGVPAGFADGIDNNTIYSAGAGLMFTSTTVIAANTAYLQRRVAGTCAEGSAIRAVNQNGTVTCQAVGGGGASWSLTGNNGTNPATNYLGTGDNQALEIKVNATRALRLEPNATSPNLLGGSSSNTVTAGLYGATISGGGKAGLTCGESGTESCWNQVTAEFSTIGGGYANTAGGLESTVAGGLHNRATGNYATVGGGNRNVASGVGATVGGGLESRAAGYAASIGGGEGNQASGNYATVPGGYYNLAAGQYSFAAGRGARAEHDGSFVWADSTGANFSSTAANQFLVRAGYGVKIVRGANAFSSTHAALQVDYAENGGEAAWFYNSSTGNDSAVLRVLKQPVVSGADANFIQGLEFTGTGGGTPKFHIDPNGTFVSGSDFAEALPVAGDPATYEPGDVLVISSDRPGAVVKCSQPYDARVLGVYSTRPGVLGADKAGVSQVMAGEVPVAVLGIVPVKVSAENGPIQPGDLLTTSSTPGHAMRCLGLERCFGRTLGKALTGLPAGQSMGVIQVLVTLQ